MGEEKGRREGENRQEGRQTQTQTQRQREILFFVHPKKMFYTCPFPKWKRQAIRDSRNEGQRRRRRSQRIDIDGKVAVSGLFPNTLQFPRERRVQEDGKAARQKRDSVFCTPPEDLLHLPFSKATTPGHPRRERERGREERERGRAKSR